MSNEFSRCSCAHCGGHVEFPEESAGTTIACPHCSKEITLSSAPAPAQSRNWKGRAAIAAAFLLVVAVPAAAFFIQKSRERAKLIENSAQPMPRVIATAPALDLEPKNPVIPVLAPYQSGLTAKEIRPGREIYVNKCSECHRFFDPASYGEEEWKNIIGKMRGKAKLNQRESAEVDRFIRSVRSEGG